MKRVWLLSIALAVGLVGCANRPKRELVILQQQTAAGAATDVDWQHLLSAVDSLAKSGNLIPLPGEGATGCQGWQTAPDAFQVFAMTVCPEHDERGSHFDPSVVIWTRVNWWSPFSMMRVSSMRSEVIGSLRADFGERIKVIE